ncbi:MAG: poly-gamma-glutamate synthase PgsB [Candidatus Hydrogenedentota bacterium]|nr:MAG: poly-gamma-glutamate synthase PgsB [Candidatus Hydrogenedentota bacterium]
MTIMLGLSIVLFLLGIAEYIIHLRNVKRVVVRIHVNGIRGKSMTTRFIAGGLRAAGFRVLAKTTGSSAQLILEDGTELPIKRRGMPRIIEQARIMSIARKRNIDVLVMECMAISPEIQWVSEHRLVRSHIGVITNVRLDHTDYMGSDLDTVAATLSLSVPRSGTLVTTRHQFVPQFKKRAKELDTAVVEVTDRDITEGEVSQFNRPVFRENLALALKVCSLLGVSRDIAMHGMRNTADDPGAFNVFSVTRGKRCIYLVNAFAANDPESTMMAWELWRTWPRYQHMKEMPVIGLFNNRLDRGFRLKSLSEMVVSRLQLSHIILVGRPTVLSRRTLIKVGVDPSKIIVFRGPWGSNQFTSRLIEEIDSLAGCDVVLFGFGNVKGPGQQVIEYFQNNGRALP